MTGRVVGGVLGALAGLGAWIAMIVITTGVCAVPVLGTLWCTVPVLPAPSISSTITVWDLVTLVAFVAIGATTGWESQRHR